MGTIKLDNDVYYSGQTVSGRVEYLFTNPVKLRCISINFKGQANTFWTETEEGSDGRKTEEPYTANEDYFNISYNLLGGTNGPEIELPAGPHAYNFTCTLPPVLPSSFEGKYGYVKYTITVNIDRPMATDMETKHLFTVINPLDLNTINTTKQPIRMQFEKTFCCLCCASGPLSLDVNIPASGFCTGQTIPVHALCENKSNVKVQLVKVILNRVVTFRTTSPRTVTKKTKDVVVEVSQGPVLVGETKQWNFNLDIPMVPPSNLVNCGIIDLDYEIKVVCAVSGAHMDLSEERYITIGTVPFNDPTATAPNQLYPNPSEFGWKLN